MRAPPGRYRDLHSGCRDSLRSGRLFCAARGGRSRGQSRSLTGLVTVTKSRLCGLAAAAAASNVLRFLPPLVIGEDLLEEGLGILEDAFASL
jgi:acetylornithine/succinyldiaminopimelate/putrescine aminotransferase